MRGFVEEFIAMLLTGFASLMAMRMLWYYGLPALGQILSPIFDTLMM